MEGGRRKMVFCLREEVLIWESSIFIQHQRMDGSWHQLFPLTLPGKDGELKLFNEVWADGFNKVVTTFCLRPQSHRRISVRTLWLKLRQWERQEQRLILMPINPNVPKWNVPEFWGSLHKRHLEYHYIKWIWIFPFIDSLELQPALLLLNLEMGRWPRAHRPRVAKAKFSSRLWFSSGSASLSSYRRGGDRSACTSVTALDFLGETAPHITGIFQQGLPSSPHWAPFLPFLSFPPSALEGAFSLTQ